MDSVLCKQSIVLSGECHGQKIPVAIANDYIAYGSHIAKNKFQLCTTDGCEVCVLNNHTCIIEALCFGKKNEKPIVASACQRAINLWELSCGSGEATYKQVGKDLGEVLHMVFSADDVNLLVCIQNELWIINVESSELVASIPVNGGNIITAEFSRKDPRLIVSLNEGRIYTICDLDEKCQIYQSCIISSSSFLSLSMHPFETFFVTGSTDGMLRMYDMSLNNSIHEFNVSSNIGKVYGDDDVGCSVIALEYLNRSKKTVEDENIIREVIQEELYLVVACTSCILLLNANSMEMLFMTPYADIVVQAPSCNLSAVSDVVMHVTGGGQLQMVISNLFSNEIHICEMRDTEDPVTTGITVLSLEPLLENSPLKADLQPKAKQSDKMSKKATRTKVDKMNQPLVFHGKIKSSGYFKDKPRTEMFQPKINKTKSNNKYSNNVGPWGLKGEVRNLEKEYPIDSPAPTNLATEQGTCVNESSINSLSFSGSGKSLACSLSDHSALLMKIPSMKSLAFTGHNGSVNTALMNRDNNLLITSSEDMTVKLWSPEQTAPILDISYYKHNFKDDGAKNSTKADNVKFTKPISGGQFYYNDKFILISHGNSLLLYKYHIDPNKDDVKRYQSNTKYKLVKDFEVIDCQKVSTFSAINSFYSYVAICACSNRSLVVFDINKSQSVLTIPDAHTRPVHSLCQNQGSVFVSQTSEAYDLFVTSAIADGVKLWDLRVNRCVRKFEGHVNRAHNVGLAYSPCSRFIGVGSEDNATYIYDIRSVSFLHRLTGQNNVVTAVSFHPQYPMLACGSLSGKLCTYNVK